MAESEPGSRINELQTEVSTVREKLQNAIRKGKAIDKLRKELEIEKQSLLDRVAELESASSSKWVVCLERT